MPDQDQLILAAIGPDQVGLVEAIAAFITRRGCNIEDSKMAAFCGEFAIIILISGDDDGLTAIARDYPDMERMTGLNITIKTPAPAKSQEFFLPYKLTASCMDHPGVVYQISAVLRKLGINIESMETKTYQAPVSGAPLFQLEAHVAVPTQTNIAELRERLIDLEREENIDIELSPVKS